jgi:hypothetical protein
MAIDDPQMLAHAIMMAGLLIAWRSNFSLRAVCIAAITIVIGGFTKHLLLALPAAMTVMFVVQRRDRLPAWLGTAVVTGLLLCAVAGWAYGADFFHDLLSGRVYSPHLAKKFTEETLRQLWPLLIPSGIALVGAWRSRQDGLEKRTTFALSYVVFAAATGIAAAGGQGVDINAFFDLVIASSLCIAIGVDYLWSWPRSGQASGSVSPGRIMAGCGTAVVAVWMPTAMATQIELRQLPQQIAEIRALDSLEAHTRSEIGTLRTLGHGRAACEELALCYWAHSAFEVDFFNFGQKLRTHALSNSACEQIFSSSHVTVVQLQSEKDVAREFLTVDCYDVIRNRFTPLVGIPLGEVLIPVRTSP